MSLQQIDPSVFIADGVQLFGQIRIARDVSLWPNAVIRAEAQEVTIGRMTNLQDFVMVHIGYDNPTHIGAFCSITHHATVHGAIVEDSCLIGINAVVMDGAVIGRGSIVAPGAVVTEGTIVAPHSIVAGVPGKVIRQRDCERDNRLNAWQYHRNAQAFRQGNHRAWDGPGYHEWLAELVRKIEDDSDLES